MSMSDIDSEFAESIKSALQSLSHRLGVLEEEARRRDLEVAEKDMERTEFQVFQIFIFPYLMKIDNREFLFYFVLLHFLYCWNDISKCTNSYMYNFASTDWIWAKVAMHRFFRQINKFMGLPIIFKSLPLFCMKN